MYPIKNDNDNFESVDEFIDTINRGGEIEFEYRKIKHSITHSAEKIYYVEMGNEISLAEFNNIAELLRFKILGKEIQEIVLEMRPFFRIF